MSFIQILSIIKIHTKWPKTQASLFAVSSSQCCAFQWLHAPEPPSADCSKTLSKSFPTLTLWPNSKTSWPKTPNSSSAKLSRAPTSQPKSQYSFFYDKNLFDYLDTPEGDLEVLFLNDPLKASSNSLNTVEIFFFNPKYHDLKAVGMQFDLKQLKDDNKWSEIGTEIKVEKFYKARSQS